MAAAQQCVENDSTVISMSLRRGAPSETRDEQFYEHYKNDDVLIIATAGNDGNSALNYLASYQSVMSAVEVDSSKNKADFSQFNEEVEIAAPGVAVTSTVTGDSGSRFDYGTKNGTSMATPHATAFARLLRMFFPDCNVRALAPVSCSCRLASGRARRRHSCPPS